MKMKSLNIKGQKYRVKFDPKMSDDTLGECDKIRKIIRINSRYESKTQHQALLHEASHAIFHEVGLDQAISGEIEEVICESFSTAFYKLFFK
jgi:Zn-dependent peptidase ImmA (M78 family)